MLAKMTLSLVFSTLSVAPLPFNITANQRISLLSFSLRGVSASDRGETAFDCDSGDASAAAGAEAGTSAVAVSDIMMQRRGGLHYYRFAGVSPIELSIEPK